MLKLYDQNMNPLNPVSKYTDLCIESELSSGDKTLTFTYHGRANDIRNEYYIETEDDLYVVKEIDVSMDGYPEYVCQLCLEALESFMVESFSAVNVTLEEAANLALVGTGWRVRTDIDKIRSSVATTKKTPLELLEKIKDAWMCEIRYDTKEEIVYFEEEFGEDKGVFFEKSLNLTKLKLSDDSYDYCTRLIPIGADDLRITDVNGGVEYVENYQYSNKIKTLVWEDTSYEDAEALKEDAEKKLEDLSKPAKSYSATVVDLAKQRPEYSVLDFGLGDTILLLDEETGIKEKQRISKLKIYPDNPAKNTCELANTFLTFEELQSKLQAAANAFEDITNADGTVNGYYVHGITSDGVVVMETIINPDGSTSTVQTTLTESLNNTYDELYVVYERVGTLEATSLTVTEADIRYATIESLTVTNELVYNLEALYGEIESLVTTEIAADIANIKTILAGGVGTGDLQTIYLTAENVVIDKALVESIFAEYANIANLLADVIYTDYVTIQSEDGSIVIQGTTMQISDSDGNVRLQLGEDAEGNFTFVLYDETGTGVMIDSEGIHASAVPDGLIVNDMVADDAAIAGSKLDIASVAECLTEDGSLQVTGSQVTINGETLDAWYTSVTNQLEGLEGLEFDGLVNLTAYFCLGGSDIEPPLEPGVTATAAVVGEAIVDETQVGVVGWTTDRLIADEGEYLWVCYLGEYADGSIMWSTPVCLTDGYSRDHMTALQTELTVVNGLIEAKVWQSDIDTAYNALDSQITTITDQYAGITIQIGEINSTVSTMETTIADNYSSLTSQIGELVVRDNEISATVTEMGTTITDNYTELSDKYSGLVVDIESITGRVSDVETQITEDYTYLEEITSEIIISLEGIDLSVSSLGELVNENYLYFEEKTAEITLELDSINLSLSETKSTLGQLTGEAVTGAETEYYLSTSNTELVGGEWVDECPTRTEGTYIWTRTTVTIGVGDEARTTTTDPVCLTGEDGKEGTGVDSITAYYSKSGSASWCQPHGDNGYLAIVGSAVVGTAQVDTTGEWTTEMPEISDTEYLWLCFLVTYSDGTEAWTEPCCLTDDSTRNELEKVISRTSDIEMTLESITLTVTSLSQVVSDDYTYLVSRVGELEVTSETITGRLTETEETAQQAQEEARAAQLLADGAITKATPYFATSDNPDWYPPHTDDGTLALVGSAVVGTSKVDSYLGQWSTTQPDGGDGIYIWCAYLYEYADGTEEWQEPFWIDDGSLREKVSEIVMTINSITLSVYNSSDGYANIQLLVDGEDSGSVSINARQLIAMEADDITIKSGSLTFESGTLIINSSGLTLDTDGNATFSGTLNAATGTFSGSLNAATGTFSGSLNAATGSFSGTITAGSGSIGPWTISENAIYRTSSAFGNSSGMYFGTSGLSVTDKFKVDSSGNLTATSAIITGTITADSGSKIGPWTVGSEAIYYGSSTFGDDGMYFGMDGLSLSSVFKIQSNGTLTSSGMTTFSGTVYLGGTSGGGSVYFSNVDIYCTNSSRSSTYCMLGASSSYGLYVYSGYTFSVRGSIVFQDLGGDSTLMPPIATWQSSSNNRKISWISSRYSSNNGYYINVEGEFDSSGYTDVSFYSSSSDVRLKSNVEDTEVEALPLIRNIKVRQFDWKEHGDHQKIGFIADELEELDSSFSIGGGYNEETGRMCIKSVDTFYMMGYTVKAIQELDSTQQSADNRIAELEAQIAELKSQIAKLQATA